MPEAESEPGVKRLFFALWPQAPIREQIVSVSRVLHHAQEGYVQSGRRVIPQNLHITLAFIGPVDEAHQYCLEQGAEVIRTGCFTLQLETLGFFSKPGIVWLAPLYIPAPLTELVVELNHVLAPCGYQPSPRAYQAHMTLMRKAKKPI